ncbi:hypothetical protein [Pseudomonas costantinii]|uniref:Uncharacterized protein n=1 Tax=Pseudomonas costantinii TaxID=168469 RepID=A0A1S2V3Y9_9PSED|nr:hypothetical protein BFL40_10190 [Pseudomonas costantinii]
MKTQKSLLHLAVAFALFNSFGAHAANTGELPCTTTEQCAAQAAKVGATPDSSQTARQAKGDPVVRAPAMCCSWKKS